MPITTLLFDVHRTLVDDSGFPKPFIWNFIQETNAGVSETEYRQRYTELVTRLFDWPSIKPFISIREIHRRRLTLLYQAFGIQRDLEADLEFLWTQMGTSKIYPEVPAVLAAVQQNFRCGLVSNADHDDPLIQILVDHGFVFDCVVTSEQVRAYKPDSKIFHFALSVMNCQPNEVLFIGDSPLADIWGAQNAGIQMAWLNRQQQPLPPQFLPPPFEIQNLTQIFSVLNQLK